MCTVASIAAQATGPCADTIHSFQVHENATSREKARLKKRSSSARPVALSPASEASKNTSEPDVNNSNALLRLRVATASLNSSRTAITAASVCASAFMAYIRAYISPNRQSNISQEIESSQVPSAREDPCAALLIEHARQTPG